MKSIIAFIKGIIFTIMAFTSTAGAIFVYLYCEDDNVRNCMSRAAFGDYKPNKIKTEKEDDNEVPMGFHVN